MNKQYHPRHSDRYHDEQLSMAVILRGYSDDLWEAQQDLEDNQVKMVFKKISPSHLYVVTADEYQRLQDLKQPERRCSYNDRNNRYY